jgi:hypothetical protein
MQQTIEGKTSNGRVQVVVFTAACVVFMLGGLLLVMWYDPDNVRARNALTPDSINVQRGLMYVGALALSIFLLGEAAGRARSRWKSAKHIYAREGMLPAVERKDGTLDASHIVDAAQIMGATVGGQGHVDRLPGAGMKEAVRLPELMVPDPIKISVTPEQVLDGYDPMKEPHWLLLGETGSGKSRAVMNIASSIARRYPSEFLVAERGGIDWNLQADAHTVQGYAELLAAVENERQYRASLLRANDVDHVLRLNEPLPLLVVIIEEAENIYQRLLGVDRQQAKAFLATLQDLAGLGRKQGVVLIVVTPTGVSSVFDGPTRRNLGNKLIFRSEVIVGDQWGIPRNVNLATLPSGTAYSTKYACAVTFPLTNRPKLPKSRLYHEPDDVLELPANATADDIDGVDLPDSPHELPDNPPTVVTTTTADNWQNGGVYQAVVPVVPVVRGPFGIPKIPSRRPPTPEEAAMMREAHRAGASMTRICIGAWGYKDGTEEEPVWMWMKDALEGRL